jgi:hypothetical protein
MPALSTAHRPLLVTPSVMLRPVSLNDKTGALRTTEPTAGGVDMLGGVSVEGPAPEPPQALKKIVMTITKEYGDENF